MNKPIVVVGGGLAGSFLVDRILQEGRSVILIDDENATSASRVAAGLYNVVTGLRAVKTWMADELLDELEAFFERPDRRALAKHLHRKIIYKPFKNNFELNEWSGRSAEKHFLGQISVRETPWQPNCIKNPFGGLEINVCGWVDIPALLVDLKKSFQQHPAFRFIKTQLDYTCIHPAHGTIKLENEEIAYENIVFCEGISARQNPFFDKKFLIPLKGQLLEFKNNSSRPELRERILLNQGFAIPTSGDRWILGSTYERDFTLEKPDALGKEAILKIKHSIFSSFQSEPIGHRAGVRPTTVDRRPLLGINPAYPNLSFFNGLGTKGVLLAPYFSILAARFVVGKEKNLPEEVDVGRLTIPL